MMDNHLASLPSLLNAESLRGYPNIELVYIMLTTYSLGGCVTSITGAEIFRVVEIILYIDIGEGSSDGWRQYSIFLLR